MSNRWRILATTLLVCLAAALSPRASAQNQHAMGFCTPGATTLSVSGLTISPQVLAAYPSCTVTVYHTGTLTLAAIFSDNQSPPTPLSNPFTATSLAFWSFYAASGEYDVQISGPGFSTFTYFDITLNTGGGGGGTNLLPLNNIWTGTNSFSVGLSATNVIDSALTSGDCVQAGTGGLLGTVAVPCILSWDTIPSPGANQALTMTGFGTTWTWGATAAKWAWSSSGNLTLSWNNPATSGANFASPLINFDGNYWTGTASAADQWQVQAVLGSGSNPTSTLTLGHSGSSGAATVSVPNLTDAALTSGNCVQAGTGGILTTVASPCSSSGGGLSGMTAGQIPVAATSTTVTSSMPLAGGGADVTASTIASLSYGETLVSDSTPKLVNALPGVVENKHTGAFDITCPTSGATASVAENAYNVTSLTTVNIGKAGTLCTPANASFTFKISDDATSTANIVLTPTTSTIAANGGTPAATLVITPGQSYLVYSDAASTGCATNGCYDAWQLGVQAGSSGGTSTLRSACGGVLGSALTNTPLIGWGGNPASGVCSSTSAILATVMAASGTCKNLYAFSQNAGVNASDAVITAYKNGSAQTLTVTLGTSTSVISDTTHSFTYVAGDEIYLQLVSQTGSTAGGLSASMSCQ